MIVHSNETLVDLRDIAEMTSLDHKEYEFSVNLQILTHDLKYKSTKLIGKMHFNTGLKTIQLVNYWLPLIR